MADSIGALTFDSLQAGQMRLPVDHLVARSAIGLAGLQVERTGVWGEEWPCETTRYVADEAAAKSALAAYALLTASDALIVVANGVNLDTALSVKFFVKHVEAIEMRACVNVVGTITSNPTFCIKARWTLITVAVS